MDQKVEEIVRLMCSCMKLESDRGVVELNKTLPNLNVSKKQDLAKIFLKSLADSQNLWGMKMAHFWALSPSFRILMWKLTDIEVRVRLAAVDVFGCLCRKIGVEIYQETKDVILRLIQSNLERNFPEDESSKLEQFETEKIVEKLVAGSEKKNTDVAQVFQEAAGCKNLETSLRALQAMVEGCEMNFHRNITNWFVRETSFFVSSLVCCGNTTGEPLVEYYKEATQSENQAEREAACACIEELASKISKESVRPFVNVLLNTLLICFQDDTACLACGNFVLCFPNESRNAMKFMFPMFYGNLSDPISSVRKGAASALARVVRAYGETALENVMAHITQNLKLGYLIGELSHIKEIKNEILLVVPLLREAGRYRDYENQVILLETIWKQIPLLAKNLGKKFSKECENALTSSATSQCLNCIAAFLEANVFGENFNSSLLHPTRTEKLQLGIFILNVVGTGTK